MNDDLQYLIPDLQNPARRERAFFELVKQTKNRLYWHIRKIVLVHDDADDVLQNTYIKVFKSIDSFRGDSQLYTWIFRIATNEALTFVAQQRIKNISSDVDYEDFVVQNMQADPYFEGDEMYAKFERAILSLPDKQRLVFKMKYFDEMPYEQISKLTGTSEGALKASYHFAVKKIEEYLRAAD